jgi:hypothetical protein
MLDRPGDVRELLVRGLRPWLLLIAEYIRQGQTSAILQEEVDRESYVMHVIMMMAATVANLDVLPRVASDGNGRDRKARDARYLHELLRIARNSLFKPRSRRWR